MAILYILGGAVGIGSGLWLITNEIKGVISKKKDWFGVSVSVKAIGFGVLLIIMGALTIIDHI